MPCYVAIEENNKTITPDTTIENALDIIEKQGVIALPVLDSDGVLLGLFSSESLLGNIIPVSIAMNDGIQLDIKIEAAPGVAKRLRQMYPLSVSEGMNRKFTTVKVDSPIWEGVTKITKYGSPLIAVDKTDKYIGLITSNSLIMALENTKEMDA